MGARFGVPSSFNVLRTATGVPKYRMAGSIALCIRSPYGVSIEIRQDGGTPEIAVEVELQEV
jgi:hypothetical protein